MNAENRPKLYITADTETILRKRFNAGNGLQDILVGQNNAVIAQESAEQVARRRVIKAAIGGAIVGIILSCVDKDTPSIPNISQKRIKTLPPPSPEIPLVPDRFQTV